MADSERLTFAQGARDRAETRVDVVAQEVADLIAQGPTTAAECRLLAAKCEAMAKALDAESAAIKALRSARDLESF